ncbi:hypothetical protein IMZ48_15200 [Candidatus Bathyarchaeota archaeon]|nr:hypothetical protein [Candidatus Bathyarchaeota archaeon]
MDGQNYDPGTLEDWKKLGGVPGGRCPADQWDLCQRFGCEPGELPRCSDYGPCGGMACIPWKREIETEGLGRRSFFDKVKRWLGLEAGEGVERRSMADDVEDWEGTWGRPRMSELCKEDPTYCH